MTSEEREKMNDLVQKIQEEQDPNTFIELVEQLNNLLDKKKSRAQNPD